jgi:hypothetical protein
LWYVPFVFSCLVLILSRDARFVDYEKTELYRARERVCYNTELCDGRIWCRSCSQCDARWSLDVVCGDGISRIPSVEEAWTTLVVIGDGISSASEDHHDSMDVDR